MTITSNECSRGGPDRELFARMHLDVDLATLAGLDGGQWLGHIDHGGVVGAASRDLDGDRRVPGVVDDDAVLARARRLRHRGYEGHHIVGCFLDRDRRHGDGGLAGVAGRDFDARRVGARRQRRGQVDRDRHLELLPRFEIDRLRLHHGLVGQLSLRFQPDDLFGVGIVAQHQRQRSDDPWARRDRGGLKSSGHRHGRAE